MALLSGLRPDEMVPSIVDVDLDALQGRGIKGLLIDVDNTLIPHGVPEMDAERLAWAQRAVERFSVCLLSNAIRGTRVKVLSELLDVPGVYGWLWDRKPFALSIRRGLAHTRTKPSETAMIGDQLFTDILAGNRSGLYTIWVEAISATDFFLTRLINRRVERMLVRSMLDGEPLAVETPAPEREADDA
ncbi:MAG: YqeG family HAD IIIA-type phosphatase [candidate division WS1 bacterium]|jgi:HAD superfamily phosphatase (TIGR01668 family)|nr:YqeG family HAD IIIA-type phosphatase [candidate division WS1 bacterium]